MTQLFGNAKDKEELKPFFSPDPSSKKIATENKVSDNKNKIFVIGIISLIILIATFSFFF